MADATATAPPTHLGLTPRVESEDDVVKALAEDAFLIARENTIAAKAKAEVAVVEERARESMHVVVEGEKLTIADRRKSLESAIAAYCTDHRAELCGSAKSRKFAHGTIAWRKSPAKLERIDGVDEDEAVERITGGRNSLLESFRRLLGKIRIAGAKLVAGDLVEVCIRPNPTRIKQLHEGGQLEAGTLERLGFRYVAGTDQFGIKVDPDSVRSEHSK